MLPIRRPCFTEFALTAATEVVATAQKPWVMYNGYAASMAIFACYHTAPVSAS